MGQGRGWGSKDESCRPSSIYLFCLLMEMTNSGQRPHDPSSRPRAPGLGVPDLVPPVTSALSTRPPG